jgi:hypothetical protein
MSPSRPSSRPWSYFRAGGLAQIQPRSGEDLRELGTLDRKLWVALSCPTVVGERLARTLKLMDTDADKRVRVQEVLAAVEWCSKRLRDPMWIEKRAERLPLSEFADTDEGKALAACARRVLINLGAEERTDIGPADTSDTTKIFAPSESNGDGVITAGQVDDEALRTTLNDVAMCIGVVRDRSGSDGIDLKAIDAFRVELQAYADWWASSDAVTLPLGEDTPAAETALAAVETKITDWFARGALVAFDERAAAHLDREAALWASIAAEDLSHYGAAIEQLPLQRVVAEQPLCLDHAVNPAWATRVAAFRRLVIEPMFGTGTATITAATFSDVVGRFAAYRAWSASKKGAKVESLTITRVRALLAGDHLRRLSEACAADAALAGELALLDDCDRLLHYARDLGTLLRNYLNFADFYDRSLWALFQTGTLYIDQRGCELCVQVDAVEPHAAIAALSKLCVLYCECTRPNGAKQFIAAAVTRGSSDYLRPGRRGLFVDKSGNEWDAVVVKFIENPISVRQAFWSPYKKFIAFIEEQVLKFAEAKEKLVLAEASAVAGSTTAPVPPAKPAFDIARFAGVFAAIGLAIGAIGAAVSAFLNSFFGLVWWQKLLVVPGIILAISLPSMAIAALKLSKRTLGPLLEGSGWAINARVRITFALGRRLTDEKKLPKGARSIGRDPYDGTVLRIWLVVLIIAALLGGWAAYEHWFAPQAAPVATSADVPIQPIAQPITQPITPMPVEIPTSPTPPASPRP